MINMKTIELDGKKLIDNYHDYLIEKFNFPDYYGRNLDGLYDVLCEIANININIINSNQLSENLLNTFIDANEDNPNINLELK